MTNLMQDGTAWLGGRLREAAGRSVTLRRGGATSAAFTAVPTEYVYDFVDNGGYTLTMAAVRWRASRSDLALAGREVLPEIGDELLDGAIAHRVFQTPEGRTWQQPGPNDTGDIYIYTKRITPGD